MNILIAADYATPQSGNFIASCVELGRMLKNKGHNIFFAFPRNQNTTSEGSWVDWLKKEGFPVQIVEKNITEQQTLTVLKDLISLYSIDILHIHFGMFHHVAINNAARLGVKILVHDHMDFAAGTSRAKQKAYCLVRSIIYRKNGVAVASVNPLKNKAYLFARHWYIPNGLSLVRNVPTSASREECRESLNIMPSQKVCMLLGWDLYRKGLDIAIKAVQKLREEDESVILGIVGIGNSPDPKCLKFIIDTTGVDPKSSWIRYFSSTEDMFAYHRAVDIYLSASRSEAFSYGILEAISQNTPVAVSNIKGTRWCHCYNKAIIYSTEDIDACASAIKRGLKIGRAPSNADDIIEKYSIEKWCNQILAVYESL